MFGKVTRKNEPFNQTSMYVSKSTVIQRSSDRIVIAQKQCTVL